MLASFKFLRTSAKEKLNLYHKPENFFDTLCPLRLTYFNYIQTYQFDIINNVSRINSYNFLLLAHILVRSYLAYNVRWNRTLADLHHFRAAI
jgi:hypothetical protein